MMYVVCTTIQNDDIAVGVSTAAYNAPQTTEIQHFWAWADKLGIWGYFRPNYQHPFWYSEQWSTESRNIWPKQNISTNRLKKLQALSYI